MLPFADTHVHLLAGLDDGPRAWDEAAAMAQLLVDEGCRSATALAHQSPHWPENTAERLLQAARELEQELRAKQVPLEVYPTGEVMLSPETLADWRAGRLLSYGNSRRHLLIEMPHTGFIDLRGLAAELAQDRIRIVVAHAERYEELLDDVALVEETVRAGCLIQVSTGELAAPADAKQERALKLWAGRGLIHVLGSDGHQMLWRQPLYRAGYNRLVKWAGTVQAERIAGIWGAALLQGLPVEPPPPLARPRSWWSRWFGN